MSKTQMGKFEVFIGTWNTTGAVLETALNPAGTLSATDMYQWLPGKHFIQHHVDARFDGKPSRSMEIIGYDAVKQQHFARSYDDQGSADVFVVELSGRRFKITGKAVRFAGGFDASQNRLTGLWELKVSRARWQPWIQLELVRA